MPHSAPPAGFDTCTGSHIRPASTWATAAVAYRWDKASSRPDESAFAAFIRLHAFDASGV